MKKSVYKKVSEKCKVVNKNAERNPQKWNIISYEAREKLVSKYMCYEKSIMPIKIDHK